MYNLLRKKNRETCLLHFSIPFAPPRFFKISIAVGFFKNILLKT